MLSHLKQFESTLESTTLLSNKHGEFGAARSGREVEQFQVL